METLEEKTDVSGNFVLEQNLGLVLVRVLTPEEKEYAAGLRLCGIDWKNSSYLATLSDYKDWTDYNDNNSHCYKIDK